MSTARIVHDSRSDYHVPVCSETNIPEGYSTQKEGLATILQKGNEAFYNPAQVVNRDLSIAAINYFESIRRTETVKISRVHRSKGHPMASERKPGLTILEGLAATGLRSIRYAKEIDGVDRIVANDLDPEVVKAMQQNIDFNGPDVKEKIETSVGDARVVMMQNKFAFDVVDLDPYGAPVMLLDSSIESVAEGGLLLCTATDMAVLCGNHGEACYAKYGAYPLHKPYCHEQAVRILLASINTAAARYKRYIVPVLSLSIDFYVRVFVRVYSSPAQVKNTGLKHSYIYQSLGCDSFELMKVGRLQIKGNSRKYGAGHGPPVPEKCPETGASYAIGGPIWSDPIHDPEWIKGILSHMKERKDIYQSFSKIQGMLTNCLEELHDVPLYVDLHSACKTLKATVPRHGVFKSALINAGYRASPTHCTPLGVKTDAPWHVVWDILRCWVKDHPVKLPEGSPGQILLSKEPKIQANFSRASGSLIPDKKGKNKVTRFVGNPEHWGPKTRHGKVVKPLPTKRQKTGEHDD